MELKALKGITKEEFIEICKQSKSVIEAVNKSNLHINTFTKYAKYLNCYFPNVGGKGIKKEFISSKFQLGDWNNNLNIPMSRASLRYNIFKNQLLPIKCNICQLDKWNELDISLELNHINGIGNDNRKENIELICPNCHAQTDTYRGKNLILKYGKAEPKVYDKERQRQYNIKSTKDRKPNKWHSYSRTREQYLIDLKQQHQNTRQKYIDLIHHHNIDFLQRGWRLKVAKLLNITPQRSGEIIKSFLPEIWEKCWKHK